MFSYIESQDCPEVLLGSEFFKELVSFMSPSTEHDTDEVATTGMVYIYRYMLYMYIFICYICMYVCIYIYIYIYIPYFSSAQMMH